MGSQKHQVDEADAVADVQRKTLPYYRKPAPRQRRTTDIINEAGGPESSGMPDEGSLPDAAAASFGGTDILEVVIGNDDRVRVADKLMKANPWRQICALRIRSKTNRTYVGTGWFIAPRVLATAGHCVFMQNEGGWAQEIEVIPGKAGESAVCGKITAKKFRAVDGWVAGQNRDFDYGVIVLPDGAIGTKVGNFAVRSLDDASLKGMDAKISGYPADRDQAAYQYFHERPLMSTTQTRLNYDIDTFGGQSGSPIWIDSENHGLVAVGVHTTGGASSNSGTRINSDVIGNLIDWIREL